VSAFICGDRPLQARRRHFSVAQGSRRSGCESLPAKVCFRRRRLLHAVGQMPSLNNVSCVATQQVPKVGALKEGSDWLD